MNSRTPLLLTTLVLVAAVGAAWYFVRRSENLRVQIGATRDEVRWLSGEVETSSNSAGRETQTTPRARAPDGNSTGQPIDLSLETVRTTSQAMSQERKQALIESPPLQVLFEESRRGMYRGQFAALFRRLKLPPEQQAALISAFVTWDMTVSDLDAVMKQKRLSRDDPELKALRAEASARMVDDVKRVLGPDALTITREYTRLNTARSYVAGYGGLLSRLGSPLTFDQLEALVNAFGEVSPNTSPQPSRLSASQWEQIDERARDILTPDQWEIFRSTTPPGQADGRWASTATEALENVAQASGPNKGQ